jgi:hypothetical protein
MDPSVFSELQTQKRETLRHVEAEQPKKKYQSSDSCCDDELDPDEAIKRYESFFQSGCSNWYKDLKDFTFSSTFCRLTRDEAKVIVRHYEDTLRGEENLAATKASLEQLEVRLAKIIVPY